MYVVDLSSALRVEEVGNKAARLSKVAALGCSVPPGFVVTTEALALFLRCSGLIERIAYLAQTTGGARERSYQDLCRDVLSIPMPEDAVCDIWSVAKPLLASSDAGLAVRSSAVSEDSESASFAGVFRSFLCVSSLQNLMDSIKKCWCSLWSPYALDYARRMGVHLQPDQMAVLVQQIMPAESSGVVFTADPLTGNPWRFVLESTFGLAQDLVAGSAPADRMVLTWDTSEIIERQTAVKEKVLVPGKTGLVEQALPAERRYVPSLSDDMAVRIAQVALTLDRAFDRRLDIEWVVSGDAVHVVQARPIVALPEFFPHELSEEDIRQTWTLSDPCWYRRTGEDTRLVAPLFHDIWALEKWQRHTPKSVPLDTPMEGEERDINGYRYSTPWVWRNWTDYLPSVDALIEFLRTNEPAFRQQWEDEKYEARVRIERANRIMDAPQCASDLIPELLSLRDFVHDYESISWGPAQSMGCICDRVLTDFILRHDPHCPNTGEWSISSYWATLGYMDGTVWFPKNDLLLGLRSATYEQTKAVQELGRTAPDEVKRAFADLPLESVLPWLQEHIPHSAFLRDLDRLRGESGMTGISMQTIKDAALGRSRDIATAWQSLEEKRYLAETTMCETLSRHSPGDLELFDLILDWTQYWTPQLNDRWCRAVPALERLIEQTGEHLRNEGVLDDAGDILLIPASELDKIGKLSDSTESRRMFLQYKHEFETMRRLSPPSFLGTGPVDTKPVASTSQELTESQPGRGTVLQGRGITSHTAIGTARIALDLTDPELLNSLTEDDILVCLGASIRYYEDWTPLLMIVKGFVMTQRHAGLHHAVQIARECGVAFVHLPDADSRSIPEASRIVVNGSMGTVTIL